MRVIFVLPSAGGGGGAHSIVQEALGLNRLGVGVAIATPGNLAAQFQIRYPELARNGIGNPVYGSTEALGDIIRDYDLAIATTALSVSVVAQARDHSKNTRLKLAYYIQDYEPLFYPPGSREWTEASKSFERLKGGLLFAKTDWLCSVVEANHNIHVRRVKASIDHDVYFPVDRPLYGTMRITAMVRPKTPRRAPKRTIRILEQLAFTYGSKVEISYFGCDAEELASTGLRPSDALQPLGVLDRHQVSSTLRYSDMFLDLSDFQAFGRTGLEGMACGCVPVLPVFGGSGEYAVHGVNSFVVDTRSDDEILNAVDQFVDGRPQRRQEMRDAAIHTALDYSIARAAYSEYELFRDFIGEPAKPAAKAPKPAAKAA
ncbi:glycosyltransferase [Sphingomonas sabuli]|uniref:Glycosyltransferase n=1 Tax=Sphingomonas sabuli TaxID=2764186 RepID=A0A7G9L5B8_9SPHN|nr:glycosyltransferase [Sphingomonas sabuli]QNM83817.1 glycosyltransferase [Sphingomonas sabuli]